MRLRRWRVVASVRVFPGSGRCRSLPAAAVFLFVSVAPAVHGVGLVRCGVFSFLAPAVSVCGSGSFRCRFVCGARALRLRCGAERVVALRGACRCAEQAHRCGGGELSPSWGSSRSRGWGGATALGERCCCEHSTGHRDHRGALSPRSGRVFFAQRCHRHSSWGHTRPAWFSQGNGPVQPGFGCPRQGALGRPPRHDVLPSPACSTQPGTNLAGGNRLVPLQRSWGLEHPRQGQHLPGRGLPPQVRASLLPQALTRRTFSRCRTHHC